MCVWCVVREVRGQSPSPCVGTAYVGATTFPGVGYYLRWCYDDVSLTFVAVVWLLWGGVRDACEVEVSGWGARM